MLQNDPCSSGKQGGKKGRFFLLPVHGQRLLCAVLEENFCCWHRLVARRGLCAEEGGDFSALSALATPPAAPASPGNLLSACVPTHYISQDENYSLLATPETGHPTHSHRVPLETLKPCGSTCATSLMPSFCFLPRRGVQAEPLYIGYCDHEFGGA